MAAPSGKIIVRNLPRTYTADQLSALFSEVGPIEEPSFVSENKRLSGKFGFVTFKQPEHAAQAITKFTGHSLEGQGREGGLSVEIASGNGGGEGKPKAAKKNPPAAAAAAAGGKKDAAAASSSDSPAAAGGEGKKKAKKAKKPKAAAAEGGAAAAADTSAPAEPSGRVFIRNLPRNYTAEELRTLLEGVGSLKGEVFVSSNRRLSGKFAFAEFNDVSSATKAIAQLSGSLLGEQGRPGGVVIQYAHPGAQQEAAASAAGHRGRGKEGGAAAGASAAAPAAEGGKKKQQKKKAQKKDEGGAAAGASSTPSEPAPPAARLFINNLPPTFDSEALQTLMSSAGKVANECFVSANKRLSGRFGFVLFESVEEATKALEKFNGKVLEGQGRTGGLGVQYARAGQGVPPSEQSEQQQQGGGAPRNRRNSKRRGSQRGRGGSEGGAAAAASAEPPSPNPRVLVRNLPPSFEAQNVVDLFSKVGTIQGDVFVSSNKRLSGKFAFVMFSSTEEATKAISTFNGHSLENQGREGGLEVQYAKQQQSA